ncbi:MAG: biotin--[acetyl-CoA-carboxylase] ligase [Bacteriovoracaceae bacterium]|nr:biotin--[acetyl-CoA-carboxylase] ligase [Bacteriovoracaceae bacterium]
MLSQIHFAELSSTQDKAFELIEEGVNLPFLVTADSQTKGRGRMQRSWVSEPGRSLAATLAVSLNSSRMIGLSLVAGLAIRSSIKNKEIKIKWPNDLMLNDQKIGGILIESRSQGAAAQVAIGFGLNLFDLQSQSFRGLQKKVEAVDLGEKILEFVEGFKASGFQPLREAYEKVLWKRGEMISLQIDGELKLVKAVGVSDEGLLITETAGNLSMTDQGEIIHV